MKREIKFRGKRIDNGEWVIGNLIINRPTQSFRIMHDGALVKHGNNTADGLHCFSGYVYEVEKNTVGQFTGLKDKNGIDIYEGDILKTECGDIVKVEFDHIYCSFGIIKKGWAFFHYFHEAVEAKDCEVIGNIHDNPELLK